MKVTIKGVDGMAKTCIDAGEHGSVLLGGYVDIFQGLHEGKEAFEGFLQAIYDAGVKAGAAPPPEVKAEPAPETVAPGPAADVVTDTDPALEPTVKAKRWFGK